jgi:hypothetical protein
MSTWVCRHVSTSACPYITTRLCGNDSWWPHAHTSCLVRTLPTRQATRRVVRPGRKPGCGISEPSHHAPTGGEGRNPRVSPWGSAPTNSMVRAAPNPSQVERGHSPSVWSQNPDYLLKRGARTKQSTTHPRDASQRRTYWFNVPVRGGRHAHESHLAAMYRGASPLTQPEAGTRPTCPRDTLLTQRTGTRPDALALLV